jgi:hypothetical protein
MNAGQSMDASLLMQKLVQRDINANLLIEFYEEVAENERVFCEMVRHISSRKQTKERLRSIHHIERFCLILRDLQIHEPMLSVEKVFSSEYIKRENMIDNAAKFLDMLEKDCDIQFPDGMF